MRVFFVTHARNIDVSSVEEHGLPTYLLEKPPSPFKTDECVDAIVEAMERYAYRPNADLIAIAGPSILTAMFTAISASYGPVRMLLWDAPSERYVERGFSVDHHNRRSALDATVSSFAQGFIESMKKSDREGCSSDD